jgi:hypothetical protein
MSAADLVSHIEDALGPIDGGWSETARGAPLWFKVVRILAQPVHGATTFVTLGLSDVELALPSGKGVRQELVFCCYAKHETTAIPGLLKTVGEELLKSGKALARGDVLGPAGPLFDGDLTAFYASLPVVFPKPLATWDGSVPPTVFVWLVPVTSDEANVVARQGWSEFETILEASDPDLLDLHRTSVLRTESRRPAVRADPEEGDD